MEELRAENAKLVALVAELGKANAELKKAKVATEGTPLGALQQISQNQLRVQREANTAWNDSYLESIQMLRPDFSGKVGELFFNRMCEQVGMKVTYTGDANIDAADGTYDAKIFWTSEKKDEIKTAWRGSNGGFQHESLRAKGCDQTVFIDIAPNHFYITILAKFDMTKTHPVIGRTPHLRKGTTDVFKFDFGEVNLQRAIVAGLAIKVDESTTMEQVATFLKKFH